ncbi:peptidase M28-like protein [Halanaerobium saccharolyticum]|uniref:Peptidase M28-like protein n=1 Tax=Halanaerobium saccharolyticum TaxID=43595 RepID=A0A4R6LDW6_9FIRM|nr:M28 family peptidase [Halanaerobium saccharolyticum]TDO73395.1 peptidase M28-like protein [Halanaerobium saccharolyticum]
MTTHLDTKSGTPGALDSGTGIAIILFLSKLINSEMTDYCLKLLLLNGEDYYSTPGQIKYMEKYLNKDNNINLVINCAGIGLKNSKTAISKMEMPAEKDRVELVDYNKLNEVIVFLKDIVKITKNN